MEYIFKAFLSWILEIFGIKSDELNYKSKFFNLKKTIAVLMCAVSFTGNYFLIKSMFVSAEENMALKAKLAAECIAPPKPEH